MSMYQVEEHRHDVWAPCRERLFRTRLRALMVARCRAVQAGLAHRVVDLDLNAITDLVPAGSVQPSR